MESKNCTVTICGGGALGLVCSGFFLSKGLKVNILTGHPQHWNNSIEVYDLNGRLYSGIVNKVSANPEDVIPQSDIVFLTLPGYLIENTLRTIRPYLHKNAIVGSVVSSTGFFFMAHDILGNNFTLFGFQRVPFIARCREYGKVGDLLGYKSSLNVAIENCDNKEELRGFLEENLSTPVNLLDNFYEASLTNSNPILHTGRLYSMWRDFDGIPYDSQSLFYADWTDEASEFIIAMDNEFQQLVKSLNISQSAIPTLLDYYESSDASSLTRKMKSIEAFRSIKSPMIKTEGGWIPDFSSRYFTEDFPFGLKFIRDLAHRHNISTPVIDEVYEWGRIIEHDKF
ncbi:MAG: NAD/NADP octopine/nopaline dehydrogenase family protein [Clostridium sp.]|nr:NAD/NADP octopine/nopaline dehydrogenase family protein [Prevotella sp.]MCM1429378.1 NAD/NADP octopine/nopaline dehydrogenase family protein [Clostridium sp.]MCM1475587.1 NAD/NADP octopine/nopaline dehydrogenase family protein [Muribaculaceae bacterium]